MTSFSLSFCFFSLFILFTLSPFSSVNCADKLVIDGTKLERVFEGIGGLSGGGATSRLLIDYPKPYLDEILDYLFLPGFGASLQILKVEIGGDCQTTDGTEPSHMHTRDDLNFKRGYEWFLMVEAKKRNPNIKIYGLSWGVPGWIGNGDFFSDDNIMYHVKWVEGAKKYYNIDVDYIGIWNERTWKKDNNCTFIKKLRKSLDEAGFLNTKIVAADGDWGIVDDIARDPVLFDAVSVVGVHYPGTTSPSKAIELGKTLWSSEDYSTYSDSVGGGCWARILNQNYVNGYMTSTISWNLIASYYNGLPYYGDGLTRATYPWTGHYSIQSPIWVTAHTTQFTEIGWIYLAHENGSGRLPKGGSYVTLVPPTVAGDFSLIIETMEHDASVCIRPPLPPFTVENQTVTFQLQGGLKVTSPLHLWYTHLSPNEDEAVYFQQLDDIVPTDGSFTLDLNVNSIYTITTTTGQRKGAYGNPPKPAPFPKIYYDDFEKYQLFQEASYFADQTGSWEIYKGKSSMVMRQMVPQVPIRWCESFETPVSLIGSIAAGDTDVSVDVMIESHGNVSVGCRVSGGGCGTSTHKIGYFFNLNESGVWWLSIGSATTLKQGKISYSPGTWVKLRINAVGDTISGYINDEQLVQVTDKTQKIGFAAISSGWNDAQFDNFVMKYDFGGCGNENNVAVAECHSSKTQEWILKSDGTIRPKLNETLCITAPNAKEGQITTKPCSTSSGSLQQWSIAAKKSSQISLRNNHSLCLDIASTDNCAQVSLKSCKKSPNQLWKLDGTNIVALVDYLCLTLS